MVKVLLLIAPWAGLVLAVVGVVGIVWSLAPGRSAKRRRCQRCWYDMSGTPESLRCPECGRVAKSERRLQRRKRRWRMAFVAVFVMVLGGAAAVTPDVVNGTWMRLAPTSVLYAMDGTGKGPAAQELFTRFAPDWHKVSPQIRSFWAGWPLRLESSVLRAQAHHRIRTSTGDDATFLGIACLGATGMRTSDIPLLQPVLAHPYRYKFQLTGYALLRLAEVTNTATSGNWQRPVLDTLMANGPASFRALPDIWLVACSPEWAVLATSVLIEVAPDSFEAFDRARTLLLSTDLSTRFFLASLLEDSRNNSLRARLIGDLSERLNSSDVTTRLTATRALSLLDAIAPSDAMQLIEDVDPTVRLMVVQWAIDSERAQEIRATMLDRAREDTDPFIRRLAIYGVLP